MTNPSDILLALAFILIAGKLASTIGERFGMPTAVGKICVGLAIGPALLGIVHDNATIESMSQVGVVILMFLAGLETDMEMMRKVSVPAFAVASGGVILPFVGGLGVGFAFHLP